MPKQQITYRADNWSGETHSAMISNEGGNLTMAILGDGGRFVFMPSSLQDLGDDLGFYRIDVFEEATLFAALDAGDHPRKMFTVGRFTDSTEWMAIWGDMNRSARCPFEAAGRLLANL